MSDEMNNASAPVGVEGLVSRAISQGKRLQWSALMDTLERLRGTLALAQQPAASKPRATRADPHFTNTGNSEAEFVYDDAIACTACGGSGHRDDQQPAAVDEAMERAAEEIERYEHTFISTVGASAIIRKHMRAAQQGGQP